MNLHTALASFVIGTLDLSQWPAIALQAMEDGYDSPSLVILAGLPEDEEPWRIETYLQAALRELNLLLPTERCAALIVAQAITDKISSGNISVWDGIQRLLDEVIDQPFFEESDDRYAYDGIGFSNVYGLLHSFDELPIRPAFPWQKSTSYGKQVDELEQKLLQSLQTWQNMWLYPELKKGRNERPLTFTAV